MYWKYKYWKQGIPAKQFWKESINDIQDIMDIDNTVKQKQKQNAIVQEELNKL